MTMNDDVFDAKLKHIGDSIDKVREEGRLRGERQEKDTAEIKDKLDDLATTSARTTSGSRSSKRA